MESVIVIEVVEGAPSQVFLYTGKHADISAKAEKTFLDINRKSNPHFSDYDQNDIDAILDQGYDDWGVYCSVYIVWPEVQ